MRILWGVVILAFLAGCGGGSKPDRYGRVVTFSSGPISKACMASGRKSSNRALCGCIQTVANRELSRQEQRVAATFFKDPHRAQEIRQSDRPGNERLWLRYKAFSSRAETSCAGY